MNADRNIRFMAEIQQHPEMNAAFVEFPFSAAELFGKKGQVKVHVLFDNAVEYRGSLANMGNGIHCLGVTKVIRQKLNKTFGDQVEVQLTEDIAERTVDIPADVQETLDANPEAKELLEKMSYSHRKEYMSWITDAKKPETREKRKQKMIEMIFSGRKGL